MAENWITSPGGRKALGSFADARPVWLWSGDGKELIWSNPAARLRGGKIKKHKTKFAPPLIPIKGQVARLMRLGALGRSSLSRMQFTMGDKPVSVTCACMPVSLEGNQRAMLITQVDPIDADLQAKIWKSHNALDGILGEGVDFALYDADGALIVGTPSEAPDLTFPAGPDGETIAVFERVDAPEQAELEPDAHSETEEEIVEASESLAEEEPDVEADENQEEQQKRHKNLSALLEQLSNDGRLFEPLSEADDDAFNQNTAANDADTQVDQVSETETQDSSEPQSDEPSVEVLETDDVRASAEEPETSASAEETSTADEVDDSEILEDATQEDIAALETADADDGLWLVVGRGFVRHFDVLEDENEPEDTAEIENAEDEGAPYAATVATDSDTPAENGEDAAQVEKTSRYNFAELSRILNDRISSERAEVRGQTEKTDTPAPGELVNLSDETLVLNRLTLGVLIFRDQQILFVNRAMTDLAGYPDAASLRAQGLEGVFPRNANDDDPFGPVTHLAHRGGGRVPVSARLQAISWQGTPALMLTASAQTPMRGIEGAIRSFSEQLAAMQGCGYFETSRAGIISSISGRGADLFGRAPQVLIGRPLMLMADQTEMAPLRAFLEQSARKAETTRPSITLRGTDPRLTIYLFAEGQAGLVTGYFGIIQRDAGDNGATTLHSSDAPASHIDPTALTRMGRNIRRPLNTIIGFAELLQTSAFGPIENTRYVEYARDIKTSGLEIGRTVDELEQLVRIDSGDYPATPVEFDLAVLLDKSISRVRRRASQSRVFVRSAISEHLPRIRADEASLGQAILNLLASAIEQTPPGGHVVVSAQQEDDGSVAVHVRDSGASGGDIAENFMVFSEEMESADAFQRDQGSSMGLALTRSLLAINTCTLAIEAGAGQTTILSLIIPAELASPGY